MAEAAAAASLRPPTPGGGRGSQACHPRFDERQGSMSSGSGMSSRDKKHQLPRTLERSKSVTAQHLQSHDRRNCIMQLLVGDKPMLCPAKVPLDLLFFRRIFSNLHRRYGNGEGEVPVAVFQRSVVRLFRVLGMDHEFNASEYDVDQSGAVGWYEFVTCWQRSKMSVSLSTAERAFLAMEDPSTCFVGQVISISLTMLIMFSCVCFILGTLPSLRVKEGCATSEPCQPVVFEYLEAFCVGVFTLEYIVRLVLAPLSRSELLDYEKILEFVTEHQDLSIPTCSRRLCSFLVQPMNVIDLFVIAPYYLELMVGFVWSNLTVLRVLRLTRLFRLVKLGRYFEVLQLVVRVLNKSVEVLNVLFIYLMLGMCFSAALMYVIEGGSWDDELQDYVRTSHEGERSVSPFKSIPHSCWWCIVTFTTVGYGDVVPVTTLGKLVAACTMITGVLVLAMPISAISLNFGQVWEEWVEERRMEAESRHVDILSVTKALQGMESRSRLLLELYDDSPGGGDPEFLGEVDLRDMPVASAMDVDMADDFYELKPNLDKRSSHKVSGMLLVGYKWSPKQMDLEADGGDLSPGSKLLQECEKGTLEVRIQRAQAISPSDWKKAGLRDIFVEVHCWPKPPSDMQEEATKPTTFRTTVARDTLQPVWEQTCTFEYDWPRDWRPVEEQMFGNAKFWAGSKGSASSLRSDGQGSFACSMSRSSDLSSPGRPRGGSRQRRTSKQKTYIEEENDEDEEEEVDVEVQQAPRRRHWRTRSEIERARLECIHGFYRSGNNGTKEFADDKDGRGSPNGASALPLLSNGHSNGDAVQVSTLKLPDASYHGTDEVQTLRRCVDEQGREIQTLSSRMVEIHSTISRLEALLLRSRADEADSDQRLQEQRTLEQPPHACLKEAAQEEHTPPTAPVCLPGVPGSSPESHSPA